MSQIVTFLVGYLEFVCALGITRFGSRILLHLREIISLCGLSYKLPSVLNLCSHLVVSIFNLHSVSEV